MFFRSKFGWTLVGIYGVFFLYCLYHVFFVSDHWFYAVLPALPWFLIFHIGEASNAIAYAGLAASALVNIFLFYIIGTGIERILKRAR